MRGDLPLKQAIEEYRGIYLAYRNFAQRTREEYINDLEDLDLFLEKMGIHTIGEVRLPHLVRYMAELDRRGYAGSTRKRKTISIKSFFNFLHIDEYTITNVGSKLILPLVEAREPRYLSTDEIDRLLKSAKGNKRDYAIVLLFLHTGIKLSELVRLTVNALVINDQAREGDSDLGYIRVMGTKRNKERIVPINEETSRALKAYLTKRENTISEHLFLNRMDEGIGERGVEKVLEKYFKLSGITKASVNSLRNTFGVYHLAKGANLKTIRNVMGYKDCRSTQHYLSLAKELEF